MASLEKDYYAIGLHPLWEDIIIEFVDIELNLATTPRRAWILGYLLDGYSGRATARELRLNHKQVQREVERIKEDWRRTHE